MTTFIDFAAEMDKHDIPKSMKRRGLLPPVPAEEATDERIQQVAAALKHYRNPQLAHSALFLAKLRGAKVDFEFDEFPTCPYSPGVRVAIDEGVRFKLFSPGKYPRVQDRAILKHCEDLQETIRLIKTVKDNVDVSMIASALLYYMSKGYWGPRMVLRAINDRYHRDIDWSAVRCAVWRTLKHVDRRLVPEYIPQNLVLPFSGRRISGRRYAYIMLKEWWVRVIAKLALNKRARKDMEENGLWALPDSA